MIFQTARQRRAVRKSAWITPVYYRYKKYMNDRYLIQTEDGTSTLFLRDYSQAMHSVSGAYEESLLKHVLPSEILNSQSDTLHVLDVG